MSNPNQAPAEPQGEADETVSPDENPCLPEPLPEAESATPEGAEAEQPAPAEAAKEAAAPPVGGEEELALLKQQNEQLRDQMLRALAEAENTRRRADRDRQDIARYAITDFARDLLATADNLRRALDAVPDDAVGQDGVLTNLSEGVAATERELQSAFEKFGVRRIEALDQTFDPNVHQAMFEVPDTGKPAGTVVQVIQDGYMIHDRLLRPALVGIAKAGPAQQVDTTA